MVAMVFPLAIHPENTFAFLNMVFQDMAMDVEVIIKEMLREIFNRPPGQYGITGQGLVASVKVQIPPDQLAQISDKDLDESLHAAKNMLMGELVAVALGGLTPQTPYAFQGDTVLVYLPLPENCVDPIIRASAVPYEATRYLG